MKKLLSILGAAGLVATTSATVVSCEKKEEEIHLTEKEQAYSDLKTLIQDINNEKDKEIWGKESFRDLFGNAGEVKRAQAKLEDSKSSAEDLKVAHGRLTWQIERHRLQSSEEGKNHEKFSLARMLAGAFGQLQMGIDQGATEEQKNALLTAIDLGIQGFKSDSEDYEVIKTDLNKAVDEFNKQVEIDWEK